MATPIFKLEAVFAGKGDALIVHCGTSDNPKWLLIDGGHRGVYDRYLRPRFNQLRAKHPKSLTKAGQLPLDLVMVSHADSDHVLGLIDLKDNIEASGPVDDQSPVSIKAMWINGFDDIVADALVDPSTVDKVVSAALGQSGEVTLSPSMLRDPDLIATIASTRQCRALRQFATTKQIPVNAGFGGDLVRRGDQSVNSKRISVLPGLRMTVLGPDQPRIEALRKRWAKDLKKILAGEADVTAFDDRSPHNLASIMVLVERSSRTMLLTGDGRGDHLVEGLIAEGLLKGHQDRLHVDVFKIPHHGSSRNATPQTFATITADDYVISANGEDDNPDPATLDMLVQGRAKARLAQPYRVHFTFPDRAFELINDDEAAKRPSRRKQRDALKAVNDWMLNKKPPDMTPVFRAQADLGVTVDLLADRS